MGILLFTLGSPDFQTQVFILEHFFFHLSLPPSLPPSLILTLLMSSFQSFMMFNEIRTEISWPLCCGVSVGP